jgi:hypothetical protein
VGVASAVGEREETGAAGFFPDGVCTGLAVAVKTLLRAEFHADPDPHDSDRRSGSAIPLVAERIGDAYSLFV